MLLRNFATLLTAAFLSALFSFVLNTWSPIQNPEWPIATAFLFLISLIANFIYSFQKSNENLTGLMFGGVAVRLLLGMIALVIYWYLYTGAFFAFALHFIVQYIVFTIAEINFLSYLVRIRNKSAGN